MGSSVVKGSTLLLASLLVLATLAAYANCFSSPFVLDDRDAVVTNQTIRSLMPLSRTFSGPLQSSTAGRPLANFSFAVNYAVGGLDPVGYHAANLVIHILCGLLLFGIIRRTAANWNGSNLLAFFCALVWLLHPLETEAVDYVTQRTESLMALAYFATLYAVIRGVRSVHPWRWYVGAVIACLLGMLCKESMATAPLMVLLYDAVFCAGSWSKALRQRAGLYAGLGASYIVLAILVSSGARSHSAGFSSGVNAWSYLLNQAPIVVRYVRLAVWPSGLVFDYGLPKPLTPASVLLPALLVVGGLVMTAVLWMVNRRLAFLGTWFFVTLAPTSSVIPIATEVGAERRMYVPIVAIVIVVVFGLARVLTRSVLTGVVMAVAIILAVLTFQRNTDYHDPLLLWRQVVARYPHGRAHYNLGLELKDAGRRDEAIREYRIAATELPDAEYALAFEATNDGHYDEAITRLRRYLELAPLDINAIRASNLLGRSLMASGRLDEATAAFRNTLRMQPNNDEAIGGLGESLLKLNRLDQAALVFRDYVTRWPDRAPGHFNLGLTLLNLHRFDEAVPEFLRAIALNPGDPATHGDLATALVQLGRIDEAIAQFREAAAREGDPSAREDIRGIVEQLEAQKKGAGHR